MTGPDKLRQFIAEEEMTQEQFAEKAKVPGPQVSLWLSGKRKPNLASAFKLERATRGIVRATDWLNVKSGRAA